MKIASHSLALVEGFFAIQTKQYCLITSLVLMNTSATNFGQVSSEWIIDKSPYQSIPVLETCITWSYQPKVHDVTTKIKYWLLTGFHLPPFTFIYSTAETHRTGI